MNKKIIIALIVVLVAVCGVSTYFHIKGRIESEENKKMYETVAEEVSATEDSTAVSASEATVNPFTAALMFRRIAMSKPRLTM